MKKKKKRKNKKISKKEKNLKELKHCVKYYGHFFDERVKLKSTKNVTTNSWFTLQEKKYSTKKNHLRMNTQYKINNISENSVKAKHIKIYPSKNQRKIIKNWMRAHTIMYNETLRLFKENRYNKTKITLNWKELRTKHLKNIKKDLINNTGINSHSLDGAIQDACAMTKSAISNFKAGNIKHFRLRYLKQNRPNRLLKVENSAFSKTSSTIFIKQLGKEMKTQDNFDLRTIKRDCKLLYKSKTGEMILLVPENVKPYEKNKVTKNDCTALDMGIRCFATCSTSEKDVRIGENMFSVLKKHVKKIDKINNSNVNENIKKKVERKQYFRISNKVDDMHWKVIKYMIENNKNILIGNLSTKSIVKNKDKNDLNDMIKRVGLLMKLYVFKQRLQYKCSVNGVEYGEIDEGCTSKTCSKCGFYKEDLGSTKTYKCNKCKLKIDRDVNGSRNILLKGIKKMGLVAAQHKDGYDYPELC